MNGVCASSTATTAKGSSCRGTHGVLKEYSQGTHGYSRGTLMTPTGATTGKGLSRRGAVPKERPGRPRPAGARPTEGGVSPTILSPRSGGQRRAQPIRGYSKKYSKGALGYSKKYSKKYSKGTQSSTQRSTLKVLKGTHTAH